ncbi:MAG: peptidylprolyl isomerase [Peptococcaceae bacterium]|nr:peptidylprolyl isomerase [Peptococcaceae bacterium]
MANPVVTLEMENRGVMRIELYPDVAPNTVRNFVSLIKQGFYDGLIFHRVIPGFMIQGGCPEKNGTGNPGYAIKGEFEQNGFANDLKHKRGVVSMARGQAPDSAGSQFFIMVADSSHLDRAYAAFGQVIEGIDVADAIVAAPRNQMDRPLEEQRMVKMTVETFGEEHGEPERL